MMKKMKQKEEKKEKKKSHMNIKYGKKPKHLKTLKRKNKNGSMKP